MLRGNHECR
jgi:serine/threonine-protein phosphatase 2B catalytic subunit